MLEKHPDFFRDFRGDTVHASTLQVLDQLDLIERFERLPQQRTTAGLVATEYGSPLDVLWYRVPRATGNPSGTFLRVAPGALLPMIDRRTYWQGAYTIPKGGFVELPARGIEEFRSTLRACLPFLGDRADEVSWDGVGFLEVRVNRLGSWSRPGLLCIGDAAHAMSPIGGVGINLAIQDAVATANILAGPLLDRRVRPADLRAVQRRRELPTRLTQRLQLGMQRTMIGSLRAGRARIPEPMRLAASLPPVRRLVSRFLALGCATRACGSPWRSGHEARAAAGPAAQMTTAACTLGGWLR